MDYYGYHSSATYLLFVIKLYHHVQLRYYYIFSMLKLILDIGYWVLHNILIINLIIIIIICRDYGYYYKLVDCK